MATPGFFDNSVPTFPRFGKLFFSFRAILNRGGLFAIAVDEISSKSDKKSKSLFFIGIIFDFF